MAVDVLAIMAHPDDAELLCGGALALSALQGRTVGILDLTAGEGGTWGTAETRAGEAASAAAILGVAVRVNAGLPDAALENSPDTRARIAGHVRALRPRTVILHWPEARHPDHRAASLLGYEACFIAGLRRAPVAGEPYRPHKIVHCLAYREEAIKPSFVVDITPVIDRKLDAIFAFGTQFENRTAMGDVFGGGERPLREQILAHAAHYGSLIRRPYGEPYWLRETLRVDDIVDFPVNSM